MRLSAAFWAMRLSAAFRLRSFGAEFHFVFVHSHLPHWLPPHSACFLTWHLAGSLPADCVADVFTSEGAKFVAFDRVLDVGATGPRWLERADVASAVIDSLRIGERKGFYQLGSWVLMPNHIHLLLMPRIRLSRVVSGIKVTSAISANRILGRTGTFWGRDYFDRWMRNADDVGRVARYIENNPVKAGLCREPASWEFSSAYAKRGW
jgi:putative transposase